MVESEFRPLRIIPHIVPVIAIVLKDNVAAVVSSELGPDWEDLIAVLRHSYSNIDQYSQVSASEFLLKEDFECSFRCTTLWWRRWPTHTSSCIS